GPGTGGAWQHRWEALRIGLTHRIADLPGMAELALSFDDADRQAPARAVVADYYARYEAHFDLRVVRPADVQAVRREGDDFLVEYTGAGGKARRLATTVVVNASGTWGAPYVPYYPGGETFRGRHVHTTGYTGAAAF